MDEISLNIYIYIYIYGNMYSIFRYVFTLKLMVADFIIIFYMLYVRKFEGKTYFKMIIFLKYILKIYKNGHKLFWLKIYLPTCI